MWGRQSPCNISGAFPLLLLQNQYAVETDKNGFIGMAKESFSRHVGSLFSFPRGKHRGLFPVFGKGTTSSHSPEVFVDVWAGDAA